MKTKPLKRIDQYEAAVAVRLYGDLYEELIQNGWTVHAETEEESTYWWRHERVAGTCSIGAAVHLMYEHRFTEQSKASPERKLP